MSAANLMDIIRKDVLRAFRNEYSGFELATVLSPYPQLAVKVDNMKLELTKQDIIVCERLVRNTKIISLKSTPGMVRDLGDRTAVDVGSISGGTIYLQDPAVDLQYVELDFEEVLKAGDRVLVQAVPGGQKYIIIDRVVEYA